MKKYLMLMLVAACGNDVPNTGNYAPSQQEVKTAMKANNIDTGGKVDATVNGKSVQMTDVSFCLKEMKMGATTMNIFALAANNGDWAISITNTNGMPTVGEHKVDPLNVNASIVDKSTGSQPSEWQQYNVSNGTVSFTTVDAKHVAGTYDLTGTPSYPKTSGAPVSMKGSFDSPPASTCGN